MKRNYSQCPGECYDAFWEEDSSPAIDINELFDKWREETSPRYFVKYKRKVDDKEWKEVRFSSMEKAIAVANLYLSRGFLVDRVYTVIPPDPLKDRIEAFYQRG